MNKLVADSPFLQGLSLLQSGGPVLLVLLALSIVALAIILLKLYQFRVLRINDLDAVEQGMVHWRQGRAEHSLQLLAKSRNPAARVLETAVVGRMDPRRQEDRVREEAVRIGAAQLELLRANLRGLEAIAALSPLLGLFGTVLGMIEAFKRLEEAGSQVNPAILSGGIWEALLTTAAGLAVAIPAVAALNWLESRLDRLGHYMEDGLTRVFTAGLDASPAPQTGSASSESATPCVFSGRAAHDV